MAKKGLGNGLDTMLGVSTTQSRRKKETEVKEVVKEVIKEVKVPVDATCGYKKRWLLSFSIR